MKIQGIFLSWIVVKDIQKAVEYYTKDLGLTLQSFDETYGWAELAGPDGCVLGMCQENQEYGMVAGTNAVVTITVDNIEQARQECIQKGITLEGEVMEVPGHVKLQTVKDQSGNTLQLVEKL